MENLIIYWLLTLKVLLCMREDISNQITLISLNLKSDGVYIELILIF